jgi:hypothetical protein
MARPRKYLTEAERIEARRKADRERVKRHRDAKKAEAEHSRQIADSVEVELPVYDPSVPPPEVSPEEVARRAALQRARDLGTPPPIYDDGIEIELPTFDAKEGTGNRTN